ncbi:unnamed protein product [Arctia plantaginis]|uniref:SHSP domain-containing protein n=1 Tax=Arctia plantaginis TaxID=874455 RepID=A0A8S0ZIA5_ARCPL|nr:unnamed protein product [Arctia plantaginis]
MLKRFLGHQLYVPVGKNSVRFLRSNRPTVKISEERFQIMIDLKEYTLDEISVKAHPEYLVVEGKQEKDTESGLMIRQFTRKFRLPKGCNPKKVESLFSPDGVLTIVAFRAGIDLDTCDIVEVPINNESQLRGRKPKDTKIYPPYCGTYNKVVPKESKTEDKTKK